MANIIVLYHRNCMDGFGGAYAAWKKFGADAEYIAVQYHDNPKIDLTDKEVYILDFSYPKEVLLDIEKKASKLVVLDHHIGAKDAVESVREHVFDNDHSGAVISWNYFHPDTTLPKILTYVQDNDLFKFTLPHSKEIVTFLDSVPFDFSIWDDLMQKCEDAVQFEKIIEQGKICRAYFDYVCNHIIKSADTVKFEGYEVFAVNANTLPQLFRSTIGNMLALKKPPFAIVWAEKNNNWRFSLRGDWSVDLTEIAGRYGGSGHKSSAAFSLPINSPLPFTIIPKDKIL